MLSVIMLSVVASILHLNGHFGKLERRLDTHHNDTQHNDTQHNDIQHNDTHHNDIQHNDTHHNDIQHKDTQHKDAILYASIHNNRGK
jgi:hypothetical protein